jgi:hypothetical protein
MTFMTGPLKDGRSPQVSTYTRDQGPVVGTWWIWSGIELGMGLESEFFSGGEHPPASRVNPCHLVRTRTLQLKGCHSPVQLDTALVAEGILHDGVQGHQRDVLGYYQRVFLSIELLPFVRGGRGALIPSISPRRLWLLD